MTGNLTKPHAQEILKDELSEAGYSPPASWYVGFLTLITDATVPTVTECADANYGRVEVDAWDAVGSDGHSQNTNLLSGFTPAGVGLAVGQTFKGFALYKASSGGTACYVKAVSDWVVAAGVEPYIPAGDLDITYS